jgi:MFS family permease
MDEETKIPSTERSESDTSADIVKWTQPTDSENPRQWSLRKKTLILLDISLLAAVGEISSSIIAPSVPEIMREFDSNNEELATFLVSVFLLGLAFGLLILSGLSEMYGRSPVFYSCSILFVAFAVGSAVAQNIQSLIIFRFFLGFCTAAAAGIGGGTIGEIFHLLVTMHYLGVDMRDAQRTCSLPRKEAEQLQCTLLGI